MAPGGGGQGGGGGGSSPSFCCSCSGSRTDEPWTTSSQRAAAAQDEEGPLAAAGPSLAAARSEGLEILEINPAFPIFSLNLHKEPVGRHHVGLYYGLCRDSSGLHVTTSCFSTWKQGQRTNGCAKVIPAVQRSTAAETGRAVCVFFFDDNLEWGGRLDSPGICNLRDAVTGEFVPFCEGTNGFCREYTARHTVIHHSSEYRNVLVKANILDAIEDEEYFSKIIHRYAKPHEKVLVYMDVNSTIMCNDTSAGKDVNASLLSSMFELIEVRPLAGKEAFGFAWNGGPLVRIDRPASLKQLVKDLTDGDHGRYSAFWQEENCRQFLAELAQVAQVSWTTHAGAVTTEGFSRQFRACQVQVSDDLLKHGIVRSWFRCFHELQRSGHVVILNSFGVDTRKVVLASVADERQVMLITVNHELWEERDMKRFASQYRGQPPQVLAPGPGPVGCEQPPDRRQCWNQPTCSCH